MRYVKKKNLNTVRTNLSLPAGDKLYKKIRPWIYDLGNFKTIMQNSEKFWNFCGNQKI